MELFSPEAREQGRKLFAAECRFIAGTAGLQDLPPAAYPEIAFAGRSNVGKSSLINALTGRKTLARASVTPGRTRQINFFLLAERLMLVDLPGYGYAKASRRDIKIWNAFTRDYLRGRVSLRRVCLLIDSRHGLKPPDIETMKLLDASAVPYQVIITKSDQVKPTEIGQVIDSIKGTIKKNPAAMPEVYATSAVHKDGIEGLRASLAGLANPVIKQG